MLECFALGHLAYEDNYPWISIPSIGRAIVPYRTINPLPYIVIYRGVVQEKLRIKGCTHRGT